MGEQKWKGENKTKSTRHRLHAVVVDGAKEAEVEVRVVSHPWFVCMCALSNSESRTPTQPGSSTPQCNKSAITQRLTLFLHNV